LITKHVVAIEVGDAPPSSGSFMIRLLSLVVPVTNPQTDQYTFVESTATPYAL
jgi:hypothetical protein